MILAINKGTANLRSNITSKHTRRKTAWVIWYNVVNPVTSLPSGDGLYHPFMATLGMVHWVYHLPLYFDPLTIFPLKMFQRQVILPEVYQQTALPGGRSTQSPGSRSGEENHRVKRSNCWVTLFFSSWGWTRGLWTMVWWSTFWVVFQDIYPKAREDQPQSWISMCISILRCFDVDHNFSQ